MTACAQIASTIPKAMLQAAAMVHCLHRYGQNLGADMQLEPYQDLQAGTQMHLCTLKLCSNLARALLVPNELVVIQNLMVCARTQEWYLSARVA